MSESNFRFKMESDPVYLFAIKFYGVVAKLRRRGINRSQYDKLERAACRMALCVGEAIEFPAGRHRLLYTALERWLVASVTLELMSRGDPAYGQALEMLKELKRQILEMRDGPKRMIAQAPPGREPWAAPRARPGKPRLLN